MYYTYVLYSACYDRYYIGQTNNITSRLDRHNRGYVRSTKAYRPWKLVYVENYDTRSGAVKRETYLKSFLDSSSKCNKMG